jgi:hypothetical protein
MSTIRYIDVMPQAKVSVNDAILKAIERTEHTFIKAIHDEAKGYAFLNHKNEWKVLPFDFINMLAGLGYANRCLLNY